MHVAGNAWTEVEPTSAAELRLVGQQSDKDSEDPADFLLSGHRFP